MARDRNRALVLRQLADQHVAQIPREFRTSRRSDLSISLVRQWFTYEDHATLVVGSEQHYLLPVPNARGELSIQTQRVPLSSLLQLLVRDWAVDPDGLSKVMRQLNLGQSAQVENQRGEFLRVWVNPQSRTKGVERLGVPAPANTEPSFHALLPRFAADAIESVYGARLKQAEKDDLVAALIRQWLLHDRRGLILTPQARYRIDLVETSEGIKTESERLPLEFVQQLNTWGLAAEEIPFFLHLVNLGLVPDVLADRRRYRVSLDLKTHQVAIREVLPPLVFQIVVGM